MDGSISKLKAAITYTKKKENIIPFLFTGQMKLEKVWKKDKEGNGT